MTLRIFDLSQRRNWWQAVLWYLCYLAIGLPLVGIAGVVGTTLAAALGFYDYPLTFDEGVERGKIFGILTGLVYGLVLAGLLIRTRYRDRWSLVLVVVAHLFLIFLGGPPVALVLLAAITTRPANGSRPSPEALA
jgi:hypothetical protein